MLCYSFVINRFYSDGMPDRDSKAAVYSLAMQGRQYQFRYYDYPKSFYYLRMASDLSHAKAGGYMSSQISSLMSSLYRTCGQLTNNSEYEVLALQNMEKDFDKSVRAKEWDNALLTFQNMASIALVEDSMDVVRAPLQVFERLKLPADLAALPFCRLYARALRAFDNKDYAKTAAILDEMQNRIPRGADTVRYRLMLFTGKANVLNAAGDTAALFGLLREMQTVALREDIPDAKSYACKSFAQAYEQVGDTASASRWWLRYYKERDRENYSGSGADIGNLEAQYSLDKANEQMKRMMEAKKTQAIVWSFVIVILTLALSFSIYLLLNYRRIKRQQERLYSLNRELLRQEDATFASGLETRAREMASTENKKPEYASSFLEESDKKELLEKIYRVLRTSPEIYGESFTVGGLAALIGYHPRYVSQVINELTGKNFSTLLQEARVKEACRRMTDYEHYGQFSTEAMGQEVGFKSRTNFIASFKKVTGLTPAQYLKQLQDSK